VTVESENVLQMDGATWLSTEEVARRLSIWPTTVRRACRRGDLVGRRIGQDWWIDERSLVNYRPVYGRGNWGPRVDDAS